MHVEGDKMKKIPVAVAVCKDYEPTSVEQALTEVLTPIGGLDFVKPGMKIGIKLNLVSAMKPEEAATTHPALVRELCKKLLDKGAIVTLGDSPGGLYTAAFLHGVYKATGMKQVAEETGVLLNDDFSGVDIDFPDGVIAKRFTGTAWLTKQDAIINFCKLKTHGMMGMSCAIKNMFGTIPGTMKPEYHFRFPQPDQFANMLIDLDEYWKPCLNIVDAVLGMEGNGPTAGSPRQIGMLLASATPYNLDVVCAKLISIPTTDVLYLEQAMKRGLCAERYEDILVYGDLESHIIRDYGLLPVHNSLQFGGSGAFRKVIEKAGGVLLNSKPKVHKGECIGCKKCEQICPAKAIKMVEGKPVIDRSKCIRCFCCQEFCPKGAMKVHRTVIARMITKGD